MITDPRASFFRKPWVRVRSTVAMPPYSVARITGATEDNGEIVYTVATPNATAHDWYLIIGPGAINATTGMEGLATFLTTGGYVRYDSGSTPTLGEEWGPTNGSLQIGTSGSGFWAIGGIESVAGNAVMAAIQNPAGATRDTGIALAGQTACDTSVNALVSDLFGGMPGNVSTIHFPADDGGNMKWADTTIQATVYNPWPFNMAASADYWWVKKTNGIWLLDRPLRKKPIAYFNVTTTTALDSTRQVNWSGGSGYRLWDVAEALASPDNRVRIMCPCNGQQFRVTLNIQPLFTPDASAVEWNVVTQMMIRNGAGALQDSFASRFQLDPDSGGDPAAGGINYLPTSLEWVGLLSEDWYIQTLCTITGDTSGSGFGSIRLAYLTIEPMFG